MEDARPMTEMFVELVDYAAVLGVESINELPGCWEHKLDDHWYIAVNAHDHEIEVKPEGGMAAAVRPIEAVIWFNGWLAGMFGPFEGIMCAGSAANEDEFISALRAAKAKIQKQETQ